MAFSGESLAHLRPNADHATDPFEISRLTRTAKFEILRLVRSNVLPESCALDRRLLAPMARGRA
jgi:hypothetical protein